MSEVPNADKRNADSTPPPAGDEILPQPQKVKHPPSPEEVVPAASTGRGKETIPPAPTGGSGEASAVPHPSGPDTVDYLPGPATSPGRGVNTVDFELGGAVAEPQDLLRELPHEVREDGRPIPLQGYQPLEGALVSAAELGEKGTPVRHGATVDYVPVAEAERPSKAGAPAGSPKEAAGAEAVIPGYDLLSVLGRGAMGIVYMAQQHGLNRTVAVKMILAGAAAGDRERDRFRLEAEAVARLQHPNIVQIFEIGEVSGCPFFSLEFVDGQSLAGKLGGTPQPPGEGARLVETLAGAVQYAHERGIVHRDLKPSNILLTQAGVPKISDFGLAKRLEEKSGQTLSGSIVGTPSYMAPEQAEVGKEQVGPLADGYALGAILYEMLTGRPPFKGATILDTLEQVRTREPVPPTQLQPKVPRDLETVCLKCLQKDPRQRYASAKELAEDLRRFLAGEPVQARPISAPERFWRWCRRNPRVALLGGGLFLFVVLWAVTTSVLNWKLNIEIGAKEQARSQAETNAAIAHENELAAIRNQKKAEGVADLTMKQIVGLGEDIQRKLRGRRLLQPMGPGEREFREDLLNVVRRNVQAVAGLVESTEVSSFGAVFTHQQMGDLLKRLGQGNEALQEYQKGYNLAKRLAAEQPDSDKAQANLGIMAMRLGDMVLELNGDARLARTCYEKGRGLQQQVADNPRSHDYAELDHKIILSHHDLRLGIAELQLGHPAAALAHFREALEFRRAWTEAHPGGSPQSDEGRSYLGQAYLWQGTASWHLGDAPSMQEAFKQALGVSEALVKEYPKAFWYKKDLAEIQAAFGEAQLRLGTAALAYSTFEQALKNLQPALQESPDVVAAKEVLALVEEGLAASALRLDRRPEAAKLFQDALTLREELIQIEPGNLTWRAAYLRALAHCGRYDEAVKQADEIRRRAPASPPLLLQAARCYAVCAASGPKHPNTEKALEALRAATAGDYRAATALRTDPDLASLQEEPAFKALLK